jgi:Flp pilus assembly secretin CpaC
MRKPLVLALAMASAALISVGAQEKPVTNTPAQPIPTTLPTPGSSNTSRQVPLKVQLTLSRFVGEKRISNVPYMFGVLTNAQKTSLRMGVQVPVVTTIFGPKGDNVPQTSYTYRDVGTNIDCNAMDMGNGLYSLAITVEDSSIQVDQPANADDKKIARDVPAFRSFRASFSMALRDGQSMQYASATDPVSGEQMKIDVSLSLAK